MAIELDLVITDISSPNMVVDLFTYDILSITEEWILTQRAIIFVNFLFLGHSCKFVAKEWVLTWRDSIFVDFFFFFFVIISRILLLNGLAVDLIQSFVALELKFFFLAI